MILPYRVFFRAASTSFCEANKYKNSLSTPSCRTGTLPRGTECIDCCKQYSCDPGTYTVTRTSYNPNTWRVRSCIVSSTLVTDVVNTPALVIMVSPVEDNAEISWI